MARGNEIIVTGEPKGRFIPGIIASGETPKPGQILMLDPTVDLIGGRHTVKIYNRDADGDHPAGPFLVLLADTKQGKLTTDAYAAGDFVDCYCPLPGDELNLLLKDISGTGDDHTKGEILIVDDATGKLIATTGSPETEVAVLLETVTDPTADQLVWAMWSGY